MRLLFAQRIRFRLGQTPARELFVADYPKLLQKGIRCAPSTSSDSARMTFFQIVTG
jgi:hypothetical protein